MQPTLIYCYDAWCGWCYGFSPVIKKIAEAYKEVFHTEVLSGGMIMPEQPQPIKITAGYIKNACKTVEDLTGIKFGSDYLWHIDHPDESDWYPSSEKPAIALSIFKEIFPEQQVAFVADMQYGLFYEGRDLTDDEAYRHLLEKYQVEPGVFYEKLKSDEYTEKAYYDFALCKQLQVTGYPQVLMQVSESRLHLLAKGYTDHETLVKRIELVLAEIKNNLQN
ncbi:MAG: DsbA family protein [Ferruginibacter sp.]